MPKERISRFNSVAFAALALAFFLAVLADTDTKDREVPLSLLGVSLPLYVACMVMEDDLYKPRSLQKATKHQIVWLHIALWLTLAGICLYVLKVSWNAGIIFLISAGVSLLLIKRGES